MKLLNLFKKKDIILQEVVQRGFLSDYITILTSFRQLVTREKIAPERIFISPTMFSLYNNPSNWFESERIAKPNQKGKNYNTIDSHDLEAWPTSEQLNLAGYIKYFPYNSRVTNFINSNLKVPPKTIGAHYRGTSHRHTERVDVSVFIATLEKELESGKFDQIYIATDEEQITETIQEHFLKKHNFDKIIFNPSLKTTGDIGVYDQDFDAATKVLLGDQVLLDAHSLAKCETIMGKTSNVSNYARILNSDLRVIYLDKESEFNPHAFDYTVRK